MTDYNSKNEYNGFSDKPKVTRVESLFDESDLDYEASPSDTSARERRSSASGQTRRPASSAQHRHPAGSASSRPSGSSGGNRRPASSQNRRPAPSQSSKRKNSIKRRKRKFKKLLLLYIAVLIVILIVGCIIFASYLSSYESSQPSNVASSIVESYGSQQGIIDFIKANADKTSIMGNVDEVAQTYATNIAGKKISYIENSDYREFNPSYDITADGETVAKVTLGSAGTGSFGSTKWEITSLDVTDYLPDSMSVSIQAPTGSTVTVNDTVLDSSYITSTGVPEILVNSEQFIENPPEIDIYKVSGLVSTPTVTVKDSSGNDLTVTETDDGYTAGFTADDDFVASVEDRVYAAIDSYATYFIHMSSDLANYIKYGSDLYSYIFGSDTMDPIYTAFYNYEDIADYEFAERSASNYVKYSDDCFTVDIKYALDMYFNDPTYSDDNQKMDATWVFVVEYDGTWCISDIINH